MTEGDKEGRTDERPAPEWSVEQMLAVVNAIYFLQLEDRLPPS